jgi:hypothetical protein
MAGASTCTSIKRREVRWLGDDKIESPLGGRIREKLETRNQKLRNQKLKPRIQKPETKNRET